MPSSNLDLVRSIYAAWERADWSSAEWASPAIEYEHVDGPSPGSWTGLSRMAEAVRDWLGAWEDYRVEADEYRELDGERVLVLIHWRGRGKASGVELGEVPTMGAHLFHICCGKVTRLVLYFDGERALANLGLAREGDPGDGVRG